MLNFSISYRDIIKFLYIANITESGDRVVKAGPRTA
jgi:hypothetical protein